MGDVYGGRRYPKISDNIFQRCHSLECPNPTEKLPILIQDNPSRLFFFPVSAVEAHEALAELPRHHCEGITHIWCRRLSEKQYHLENRPLAEFVCGSGIRAIILYPWRRDMVFSWSKLPSNKIRNEFRRCGINVVQKKKHWEVKPSLNALRNFYIQHILFHEVGHHVDQYYHRWSAANKKKTEEFADQYAIQMTTTGTLVFDRPDH